MLANYIATIDGYLEEEIDVSETEKGEKRGKAGVYAVEGSISSETARETKAKRTLTPPAQFQKLYDVLEKQEQIKHLGLFDNQFWNEIGKGDMLEVEANIKVPTLFSQFEVMEGFSALAGFAQQFGITTMSDNDLNMLSGIGSLGQIVEKKPIPLLFHVPSINKYSFVSDLQRNYVIGKTTDFQGDAFVFGKVQKILQKGEKSEVFSLLPDLDSLAVNRQQRLALKSNKNKSKQNLSETIVGPALIMNPLAVYR
jgi:hypothetical protein